MTSYTTRLTDFTVLHIFVETYCKNSGVKGYQSAVIPSDEFTALNATTWEWVL